MNNFCLYHQIKSQKSQTQRTVYKSSKHLSQQSGNNECPSKRIQQSCRGQKEQTQFNDYNYYPQNNTNKKLSMYLRNQEQELIVKNEHKNKGHNRALVKEGHIYQKISINSHKSYSKRSKLASGQKQKKSISKEKWRNDQEKAMSKISKLQSQIGELNRRLQSCEAETRKNHYQFVLLRDIVQKVKIQNLQLTSRSFVVGIKDNSYKANCQKKEQAQNNNLVMLNGTPGYQNHAINRVIVENKQVQENHGELQFQQHQRLLA